VAKFGDEGVGNARQMLTRSGRYGHVVCKRNRVDIFCRLSTMDEHDRQTTER